MSVEIDPSWTVILVDSLIDIELFSGRVGFETFEVFSIYSFEATLEGSLTTGFLIWGIGTDFLALLKLESLTGALTGALALVGVNYFLLSTL